MNIPNFINLLSDWLVGENEISLLPRQKWIQVIVLYEVQDYSIFRTESGEELNTEELIVDGEKIAFPVLLGRKLKAVQRRTGHAIIRSVRDEYACKFETAEGGVTGLCRKCPECFLRGAAGGRGEEYNIQSRVFYSAYYAIEPERLITDLFTRNAIDDLVKVTGAALTSNQVIKPQAHIPAIFSLYSVTERELIYFLKTVQRARRVGARVTEGGLIKPISVAITGYRYELLSPLELSLHVYKLLKNDIENLWKIPTEKIVNALKSFVKKRAEAVGASLIIDKDFLTEADKVSDLDLVENLFQKEVKKYLSEIEEYLG